ncbi:PHD finger protein 14 [Rhodnius prolixus]|uniref:PHD finger protein 14 n=1 Tax=Rhodnius prolixus TaxID=13249 RepID=UPI003D18AE0F
MERDPTKRKVKPAQALFDFEDLGESSDDSDFRIEDHCDESDDDSLDSNVDANSSDSSDVDADSTGDTGNISSDSEQGESLNEAKPFESVSTSNSPKKKQFNPKDAMKIMICTVCLGDRSDATNEIIECDSCGVTVHEGCYGVQDSDSVCSTDSPCPTTPWFCDSCKAGLDRPDCELCPNPGGIFKETDVGKWVHLVCALYMPGVAFAEVDKLQNVTLFEMAYSKWGGKACSLCQDQRFARTGVTVGCDAGMCKTYFHVTCGQREGLLAETHSEEVDQADPFYAHCKLHTDKNLLRKRRRNWLALQMRSEERLKHRKEDDEDSLRIKRRLAKSRERYTNARLTKVQPWVPTQKMARLLTSSASACRALWRKAELSGVDTESWALRQAQVEALSDVHRRWNIQPAFSVEFIGYYLDRNVRVTTMRKQLKELTEENSKLLDEQSEIEEDRDKAVKENAAETTRNQELKNSLKVYYDLITFLCPNKKLPDLDLMGRPVLHPSHFMTGGSVTAIRKPGLTNPQVPAPSGASPVRTATALNNSCGLCFGKQDQHLLAKCDTCHKFYHLGCLNPPLTRMPRKTKQMGWQCSECDKDSDQSDREAVDPEAPRKLRHKDNGNGDSSSDQYAKTGSPSGEDLVPMVTDTSITTPQGESNADTPTAEEPEGFRVKKRRREKHHRYSPDTEIISRSHKHKHKRSKQQTEQRQSLKICFKSIPHPTGGSSYVATPSSNLTPSPTIRTLSLTPEQQQLTSSTPQSLLKPIPKKKDEVSITCATCSNPGTTSNLVRCDECLQGFHFACLDPPVKKSPKVRGYSWHCANCDPTESD